MRSTPASTTKADMGLAGAARRPAAKPRSGGIRLAMTRTQSTIQMPENVLPSVPACATVTKKIAIRTISSSPKYRSACSNRTPLDSPARCANCAMSTAAPLSAEATNRPPSAQVSLQTGWFETLSSTPVYDINKNATSEPMISKNEPMPRLNSARTNDANEIMLKTKSTHVPSDIGDQYLKFRPPSPGVVLIIMCQKRSG